MIPFTLAEVAAAAGGRLVAGDPGAVVRGVSTDSRALRSGDLFVGLRGERFDGDRFAAAALEAGATAVMVRPSTAATLGGGSACVVVDDGVVALGSLARAVRRRAGARVVGITGSAGKTSTKDILAALLRPLRSAVATEANLNNEIGVPLTLLRLEPHTDVVVVELAMRGRGQIRELARIAEPDVGVVTTIAPVHLELVGDLDDVAAAKGELLEELGEGTAVVPGDESRLARPLSGHRGRVVTFGTADSDVRVLRHAPSGPGTRAVVEACGQRSELEFNFRGSHFLYDAQAALGAFVALGLPLREAREGAALVAFSAGRGRVVHLRDGGLLLDDAYNANPLATKAALAHLAELAEGRALVAVLGDMAELGVDAPAYHRDVGAAVASAGARLVAVGELARHYLAGVPGECWYASVEEALPALPKVVPAGSAVLVKASRAARFERVVAALCESLGEVDPAC